MELEKKLNDLAAQSGRPADEQPQDEVAGMFDDWVKRERVKLIDGEEA